MVTRHAAGTLPPHVLEASTGDAVVSPVPSSVREAEYITTTTAATQALWLSRLLGELLGRKVEVVELKVDNKSALALAKNPVFHDRSKHIRTKYHFIRECLEEGSIKANYIVTTDQPTTSPLLISSPTF
jgi:hypothetical protein